MGSSARQFRFKEKTTLIPRQLGHSSRASDAATLDRGTAMRRIARFIIYCFSSFLWALQISVNSFLGNPEPVGPLGSGAASTAAAMCLCIICYIPTQAERSDFARDLFLSRKWKEVRGWSFALLIVSVAWWTWIMFSTAYHVRLHPYNDLIDWFWRSDWNRTLYLTISVVMYVLSVVLSELKEWVFEQ
jgi:hypothetical protein